MGDIAATTGLFQQTTSHHVAGSEDVPPGSSTETVGLSAVPGGTRVELVHSGLPDPAVPGHADGWQHFLPRLAAVGSAGTRARTPGSR